MMSRVGAFVVRGSGSLALIVSCDHREIRGWLACVREQVKPSRGEERKQFDRNDMR